MVTSNPEREFDHGRFFAHESKIGRVLEDMDTRQKILSSIVILIPSRLHAFTDLEPVLN